jgi:hypothetical protein
VEYLVYGRELRLPIEDDWKPLRQKTTTEGPDYDTHVSEIAMRLYEASEEARKQSRLSHKLAKGFYDKRTREFSLTKGDLVYLYNPVAKKGRDKKFEYKYRGPYSILKKISPLSRQFYFF